jgi:hypothetical protein
LRFADLLRTTVLLSAGSATLLALVTVLSLSDSYDPVLASVCAGWWLVATLVGLLVGHGAHVSPPIARLLAGARHQTMLPDMRPGRTMVNRLWPMLFATGAAGVLGIFQPQVSGVATGFFIIWALAWRHQHLAVQAIEERDAARFYVDQTSPLQPIRLVRTPGFGGTFLRNTA